MRIRFEHPIPLPAERFWALIHAPRYERAVADAAGLVEYTELERREEPDAVYRRIRVVPTLPVGLRRLLDRASPGASPGYVEEQWRSRAERRVRWRMTPDVLAGRARIEGEVRVEPGDVGSCRRVLDGVVEVRLPVLGRLLERAIASATEQAYARGAEVAAELAAEEERA